MATDEALSWDRCVFKKQRYLKRKLNQNSFGKVNLTLAQFESGQAPMGKSAHKFSIVLPQNLPPSTFIKSPHIQGVQGTVKYLLQATLEGSQHAGELEVPIHRSLEGRDAYANPKYVDHDRLVGGFFGFKQMQMKTDHSLNNSLVMPGDTLKVTVDCDNANSNYTVDCFKFKILRKCFFKSTENVKPIETAEFIQDVRI